VELLFKTAKGSLRIADISSANANIVMSLVLASIIVTTIIHPFALKIANLQYKSDEYDGQLPSLQRVGIMIVHLSTEFRNALLTGTKEEVFDNLSKKIMLFLDELFDPNKRRKTSVQHVLRMTGKMA